MLCRNVLIYFTPELQRRALQLFAFSLRDGGFLASARPSPTSAPPELFRAARPRLKIFRRHGDRVLVPPVRDPGPGLCSASGRRRADELGLGSGLARGLGPWSARRPGADRGARSEGPLLRLPVGVVVIDQ